MSGDGDHHAVAAEQHDVRVGQLRVVLRCLRSASPQELSGGRHLYTVKSYECAVTPPQILPQGSVPSESTAVDAPERKSWVGADRTALLCMAQERVGAG